MKNKSKKKSGKGFFIGFIVIIILIVGGIFLFSGGESYNSEDVDTFAKCLTENGAVMHGTFWCPHCAQTKKLFGSSFQYVTYVECDPRGENEQSELCIEKGIEKYDTWEFSDGSRVVGEPTFDQLAQGSGCRAPQPI